MNHHARSLFHAPRTIPTGLALASALLLSACGEQALYSQLSEQQANEMVAVLQQAGIEAAKLPEEGRFTVSTSKADFSCAVQWLTAQGLPRESFDSIGKVFKRDGLVSTPVEERARLLHALSQELANTLDTIDGVVKARVHLVVPQRSPLEDRAQPAAASVFIKHRPDRDLSVLTTQIKALVVNSIEGLAYEHVTVALFPAEDSAQAVSLPRSGACRTGSVGRLAPVAASAVPSPYTAAGLAGMLALGGSGWMWTRRRSATATPDGDQRAQRSDGPSVSDIAPHG